MKVRSVICFWATIVLDLIFKMTDIWVKYEMVKRDFWLIGKKKILYIKKKTVQYVQYSTYAWIAYNQGDGEHSWCKSTL